MYHFTVHNYSLRISEGGNPKGTNTRVRAHTNLHGSSCLESLWLAQAGGGLYTAVPCLRRLDTAAVATHWKTAPGDEESFPNWFSRKLSVIGREANEACGEPVLVQLFQLWARLAQW